MANFSFTEDKNCTNSAIKASAKEGLIDILLTALRTEFGDENVRMVRVGNASKSNEIGIRLGVVDKDGETLDLCATVNATIKEFEDRKTAKKTYTAFNFEESANEFDTYLAEKIEKENEKQQKKEAKIAKDKANREKASESNIDF